MNEKNTISCYCGACSLKLNEPSPKFSLMCACEDCRQALRWAAQRGGKEPKDIIYSVYLRSDIHSYDGLEHMIVTQLRSDARSTRVYCKLCFSCIAIDHIVYEDNVFMMQPEHCIQDFNANTPPKAVIHLIDYKGTLQRYRQKLYLSFIRYSIPKKGRDLETSNQYQSPLLHL